MEYRRLGASGLKVSKLGLGSWLTYGNAVDQANALDCVRAAHAAGINLFDTADCYAKGAAEEFLGEALEPFRRADLVVATKVFATMSENVNDRGLSRKHIMESCEGSLRRLRTDYLDLYQCHRFDPETPLHEVVRAMDDLIRQGKILYWGTSEWESEQLREVCEIADRLLAPRPISNQPLYNMLDRKIEAEIVPTSEEVGIGQIVFSPLAQGMLTGKYQGGNIPAGSRLANDKTNKFMRRRLSDLNFAKVDRLTAVAKDLGVPLATLSLAWCLRLPTVSSVIMGATRLQQVRENAAAAELELSEETLSEIEEILQISEEPVG